MMYFMKSIKFTCFVPKGDQELIWKSGKVFHHIIFNYMETKPYEL